MPEHDDHRSRAPGGSDDGRHGAPASRHPDDHALWDAALGEELGRGTREHLAACAGCDLEVTERRRVVDAVTSPPPDDLALRPPARVLEGVRAELGLAPTPTSSAPGEAAVALPAQRAGSTASTPGSAPGSRRGSWRALVAVAAVVVLVGAAAAVGLRGSPDEDVVARADLDAVVGGTQLGTAVLHDDDGRQVLDVDLTSGAGTRRGAAAGGQFEEVWLLRPGGEPLVSLGVLGGDHGSFVVPVGALADGGVLVDVSVEPLDGGPEHSGDSLARGDLAG